MGLIKGQNAYRKFKEGKSLTRKNAMLANCYECNGLEESNVDCRSSECPLYPFSPYKGLKKAVEGTFTTPQ